MPSVCILGLGIMGKAMVKTYSAKGYEVKAWNRGEANRKAVEDLQLPNVQVYSDLVSCVKTTDIVIMNVVGDPELKTATKVIDTAVEGDPNVWKNRILVQFTSQDPISIGNQEKLVNKYGGTLIGGAMNAVAETVGTDQSVFFISANPESSDVLDQVKPTIDALGPVMVFKDDIGLGSLMDIGLIETLFFGLAAFELSIKLMELYGVSKEFESQFIELCNKFMGPYSSHIHNGMAKAIQTKDYATFGREHYNAGAMLGAAEMHLAFMEKMGISKDNFMTKYVESLKKIPASHGPSEVVELYMKDD